MTPKKIYGPWIEWHGGECPVPPDTLVQVSLREMYVLGPLPAGGYNWQHGGVDDDITEYRIVTEQADLDAAEKLLLANGYTITPPAKPLTFEDVVPMTEAPPEDTPYWVISLTSSAGVVMRHRTSSLYEELLIKRRIAYLEKEHAMIAARHIVGLKGGEL